MSKYKHLPQERWAYIFDYMTIDDIFESVKIDNFFNKILNHDKMFLTYKQILNQLYENQQMTEVKDLIQNDFKTIKAIMKKYNYDPNYIAPAIGYIISEIFNYMDSGVNDYDIEGSTQLECISKRFSEKAKLVSLSDHNRQSKVKPSKERQENIVRFLLSKIKGVFEFNSLGISHQCLFALGYSNSLFTGVTKLSLNSNNLGMSHTQTISRLNLSCAPGVNGFLFFAKSLSSLDRLKVLNLSNNKLTVKNIKPVIKSLMKSEAIITLDLSENSIGGDLEFFSDFLFNNTSLVSLDLNNNLLGAKGAKFISDGLLFNKTLKKLDISYNGICHNGVIFIADMLKENRGLTSLHLGGNYLKDEGASILAKGLRYNSKLSYVFLNWNNFTEIGVKDISESIISNKNMTGLDLSNNNFLDKGCLRLMEYLVDADNLFSLDIGFNNLTYRSIPLVTKLAQKSKCFSSLALDHNALENNSSILLRELITTSRNLVNLNISFNNIHENSSIEIIIQAVKESKTLKILDLSGNKIKDVSCPAIEALLKQNSTMQVLKLNFNEIRDEGIRNICNGLGNNIGLYQIDLEFNMYSQKGIGFIQEMIQKFKKACKKLKFAYTDPKATLKNNTLNKKSSIMTMTSNRSPQKFNYNQNSKSKK